MKPGYFIEAVDILQLTFLLIHTCIIHSFNTQLWTLLSAKDTILSADERE